MNFWNKITCFGALTLLLIGLSGCRSYTESTPSKTFEGDPAANYQRVFKEPVPPDVTVINSVVVGYSWRPGVVTTDDFEFELIVPSSWPARWQKTFHLKPGGADDAERRKNNPIRPWYAPKPIASYETYRDMTSVGYVHMLVDKTAEADGRLRVFISKH
ncbi:MAG: hypothetical protein QM760_10455 [Nibricoccus sp.]